MTNRIGTLATPASAPSWLARLRRALPVLIASLAFAVVAGVTGRVSYLHIEALTLALHQSLGIAKIMPFGIDGLIVVGSVALLQSSEDQWWLGWICVGPGAAASLFANVESGWRYGPLAAGWAGMASVGFFVATFTFERWLKAQAGTAGRVAQAGPREPEPEPLSAAAAPAAIAAPVPAGPLTPEAALLAFLESGPQREVGAMVGVSKSTVGRWIDRLRRGEAAGPGLDRDGPEDDARLIRDASSAAISGPLWSAPEPSMSMNGSAAGA